MEGKIVIIVQARMASTRLPGKIMLPVLGKSLLALMTERLKQVQRPVSVIIATSVNIEDDVIEREAESLQLSCYRGSLDNVLDRHYQVAKQAGAKYVLKIPSDCPLIDARIIDRVLDHFFSPDSNYDFVSNLHPATYPDGNDVEIMTMDCLERAWINASRPLELEHTTPYIWENPELFRIGNVTWETGMDYSMSHRFTIDYREDYEFIKRVFEKLYPQKPAFSCEDIISLLTREPEIQVLNAHYNGVNWYRHHLDELKTILPVSTRHEPVIEKKYEL